MADTLRVPTPDSPATISSLRTATANIDDLTAALSNFSRGLTPDPDAALACCCEQDDCVNLRAWHDCKSKLESRLILSAEIGQALLQKHEAYVRQHEESDLHQMSQSRYSEDGQLATSTNSVLNDIHTRISELESDNASLERRLAKALIDVDVQEAQQKNLLAELHEAHASVSKLTAHHARNVGIDARLAAVTQEKEDMQQERDVEMQRARTAESRSTYLKEKCIKLQAETLRLQEDLDQARSRRTRLSEEILQDARERLELLQYSSSGNAVDPENTEVTRVLESLVADNEALKRDNAELQNLLTESREDLRTTREELEEQKARTPAAQNGTSGSPPRPLSFHGVDSKYSPPAHSRRHSQVYLLGHGHRNSSSRLSVSLDPHSRRGAISGPPTPESSHRPLSPPESVVHAHDFLFPPPGPHSKTSPLHKSHELGLEVEADSADRPKSAIKPLFLLSQSSKGVQTDRSPSPMFAASEQLSSSTPPPEHSEASSLVDSLATFTVLAERLSTLLTRMSQSDPLTLTNRLKRQNLQGADLGHLSRSTVQAIVSEAANLRTHFRAALDDEKVVSTCSRKDLRALLKVVKELFTEYGQVRVTLNDVILDPSCAQRVSQMAMEPAKAAELQRGRSASTKGGWMAPLSRLFSGTVAQIVPSGASGGLEERPAVEAPAPSPPIGRNGVKPSTSGLSAKAAPKLAPVLAASTSTTVEVEFSSSGGKGRATASAHAGSLAPATISRASAPALVGPSSNLMGIFAGAPKPVISVGNDGWTVVPRAGQLRSPLSPPGTAAAAQRMSRNVDAMVEGKNLAEGADVHPRLLERTLRPRGLSDSSIHSTYLAAGGEALPPPPHATLGDSSNKRQEAFRPDRQSAMNAASARVQDLRYPSALGMSIPSAAPIPGGGDSTTNASSTASSPTTRIRGGMPIPQPLSSPTATSLQRSSSVQRALSPARFLPSLSNWAAAMEPHEGSPAAGLGLSGSMRDEGVLSRHRLRDTL